MTDARTRCIGLSARGDLLAGDDAGDVRLVTSGGERVFHLPQGHLAGRAVRAVAADESRLGAAHESRDVLVRDLASGDVRHRFVTARPVRQLVLDGDDVLWVDDELRPWRRRAAGDGTPEPLLDPANRPVRVDALALDGDHLVGLARFDGLRWRRDTLACESRTKLVRASQFLYTDGLTALSPGGTRVLVHWDDLLVIDARTNAKAPERDLVRDALLAAVSDDPVRVAVATKGGLVVVVDEGGKRLAEHRVTAERITQVELARDGSKVAWCDVEGRHGVERV